MTNVNLTKPKLFNFVELGPGDGSLTKVIINTLKKFSNNIEIVTDQII